MSVQAGGGTVDSSYKADCTTNVDALALSLVARIMIMRVQLQSTAMAIQAGTSLFWPSPLGVTPYRAARLPVVACEQQRCYSKAGNQWQRTG